LPPFSFFPFFSFPQSPQVVPVQYQDERKDNPRTQDEGGVRLPSSPFPPFFFSAQTRAAMMEERVEGRVTANYTPSVLAVDGPVSPPSPKDRTGQGPQWLCSKDRPKNLAPLFSFFFPASSAAPRREGRWMEGPANQGEQGRRLFFLSPPLSLQDQM